MYDIVAVIGDDAVPYISAMIVHEPPVTNTNVIGLGALSRSCLPSSIMKFVLRVADVEIDRILAAIAGRNGASGGARNDEHRRQSR